MEYFITRYCYIFTMVNIWIVLLIIYLTVMCLCTNTIYFSNMEHIQAYDKKYYVCYIWKNSISWIQFNLLLSSKLDMNTNTMYEMDDIVNIFVFYINSNCMLLYGLHDMYALGLYGKLLVQYNIIDICISFVLLLDIFINTYEKRDEENNMV